LEPQFYAELLKRAGITDPAFAQRDDASRWQRQKEQLAAFFLTKTRDEWRALLEGTDTCVAPVLDMDEAPAHPHNQARQTFIAPDGVVQPAPHRVSRTPPAIQLPPALPGEHNDEILREAGYSEQEIVALRTVQSENRGTNGTTSFHRIRYYTTIGSHEPVLRIVDGDTIITTTVDASGRDERGEQVTPGGNPQTGPFYVEGAQPGDTLEVRLSASRRIVGADGPDSWWHECPRVRCVHATEKTIDHIDPVRRSVGGTGGEETHVGTRPNGCGFG
jgi:hypothetical protein